MATGVLIKTAADRALICKMRYAGAPMREIAEKMGISKERVRQILARSLGSTKHEWLSTLQLCEMSGLPRNRILELQQRGIVTPAITWSAGRRHYFLWSPSAPQEISAYYRTHYLCHVCSRPLPRSRIRFCSDACRQERHKYKSMTPEEKKRVLANIKRYRERKRQATFAVVNVSPVMVAAVH